MNQSTTAPTYKMMSVGVSGALTVIVVYVLSLVGVQLPEAVSAALTIMISFIAGYVTKEKGV